MEGIALKKVKLADEPKTMHFISEEYETKDYFNRFREEKNNQGRKIEK